MKRTVKGSLTVFFAMIMVCVMTLMFAMAECIRVYELDSFSQEYTDMAVESAFSEYNPYLWKNYRILALDLGYGSELTGPSLLSQKALEYCKYNSNIEYGSNFARLVPTGCEVTGYSLLSDGSGQGVINLGVKATKEGLPAQVINEIQSEMAEVNNLKNTDVESQTNAGKESLANAKNELALAKENAANDNNDSTNPEDFGEPGEVEDNPLDAFDLMKEAVSHGILSTVIPADKISDKEVDTSTLPSHRTLNAGNKEIANGNAITDKILITDYFLSNYSYYGMDRNHGGMKYEVEYLLTGNESDATCLAAVVGELLLIREAANFTTIITSEEMMNQAREVALILAGFTMNEGIVELVAVAIAGAWAYIESTLDVRLLLDGGEVSLIKTREEWTSDLLHLSAYFDVNSKAKPCKGKLGMTYKNFLMCMLALKGNDTLGIRACDVMEVALNSTEDYKNLKCDNLVFAADFKMNYSADEMFLSLFSNDKKGEGYCFAKEKSIIY